MWTLSRFCFNREPIIWMKSKKIQTGKVRNNNLKIVSNYWKQPIMGGSVFKWHWVAVEKVEFHFVNIRPSVQFVYQHVYDRERGSASDNNSLVLNRHGMEILPPDFTQGQKAETNLAPGDMLVFHGSENFSIFVFFLLTTTPWIARDVFLIITRPLYTECSRGPAGGECRIKGVCNF